MLHRGSEILMGIQVTNNSYFECLAAQTFESVMVHDHVKDDLAKHLNQTRTCCEPNCCRYEHTGNPWYLQ